MSNTYQKYVPNVYLAKCAEKHEKGDIIPITNQWGKNNNCIVFNLIYEKGGYFYYSVVRADGFNLQEYAKRRAEKLQNASQNAEKKSEEYWKASNRDNDFLSLGQPVLVGHHSEKGHRKMIENARNNTMKSVEFSKKAEEYENRVSYWEARANIINLSMPESIEYYEFELEKAQLKHDGLKNGTIKREHSYSLTYAKKAVNEIETKLKLARKLWEEK